MRRKTMKNLINLLIALLLVSTSLVACATPTKVTVGTASETATPTQPATETPTPTTEAEADLEGTLWTLDSYLNSEGESVDVLPDTRITLEFKDGKIGGRAGCNTYFASYEIEGDSLTVGVIGVTEMYCAPEALMTQEGEYLAALQSAALYRVVDDKLEIVNGDGETLLSFSVLEPTPLTGTTWRLTGFNDGKGGSVSLLNGTEITALFDDEGGLSGTAGCNNYKASYEIDGRTISIGPAAATRMMCAKPDGIMEQESAYLSMLESAAAYRIKGDSLGVFDAGGTRLASYTAETEIGMANPASVYCEEQGGRLEIRTDDSGGQAGYCIFADGSECEEWAFFRGECAPASASSLSMEALKNATYPSQLEEGSTITLTNGRYEGEPFVEGGASRPVVILVEPVAFGDLDGDGVEDAAVILAANAGGSGTFISLEAVRNEGGEPVHLANYLLGDRVQIESLATVSPVGSNHRVEGGQILLEMITHGPSDPMCCPTQQVVQTYALRGDELVQTSTQNISTDPATAPDIVGTVWNWQGFTDQSGQNDIIVIYPPAYRLELLPDGQFNFKADCNVGRGTFTLDGSSITFEAMVTTLAECGPGSLYNQYLNLLGQAVTYVREGDTLTLNLTADGGDMKFSKLHAVTGQVVTQGEATLPEGARLEVKVMDVTQGTPGTQVGGVLRDVTQFPMEFEATYHAPAIDPQNIYALQVTIKDKEGNSLYTNTQAYNVLTQDNPTYHIEVMVEPEG